MYLQNSKSTITHTGITGCVSEGGRERGSEESRERGKEGWGKQECDYCCMYQYRKPAVTPAGLTCVREEGSESEMA